LIFEKQETEVKGRRQKSEGGRKASIKTWAPFAFMNDQRSAARSFQDLLLWQKAHKLVLAIYKLTAGFPKHEIYGLTIQMRRAAVSVPANIAEGFRRRGKADKVRFLNIAEGSLEETRYFQILVRDLEYGDSASLLTAAEEVSRMLTAYSAAILEAGDGSKNR
jgi:four helix bundle protein